MRLRAPGIALAVLMLWTAGGATAQQCCPAEQCPGDLQCDNRVDIAEIISAVDSALNGCPPPASPTSTIPPPSPTSTIPPKPTATPGGEQRFPATGQTTCWDATGTVLACTGTGQDGETRAGGALTYVDNGDGTITDLTTQLMWEEKAADGGLHDWNHEYQWADAFTFIAALNANGGFAGWTDWRLPNVKELQSIVDYETLEPAVSAAFNHDCAPGCAVPSCSCTRLFHYWSATSDVLNPVGAWSLYFTNGDLLDSIKASRFPVRAVRGGQSAAGRFPATGQTMCWDSSGAVVACDGTGQDGATQIGSPLAYVDNGDGTITDVNTKLMWEKKSADGSIHDWNGIYDWSGALDTFITALNASPGFAGYRDWRLPNVKELQSLIDYQQSTPALATPFNSDCVPGCSVANCSCSQLFFYWSATTNAPNPGAAWAQYFGSGYILESRKSNGFLARAVRGGM